MRKIIHVDMDCFYAAVEVKKNPALKGKPIGIGGPANSRSVLCTASYEARPFGVRSAMPSAHAVKLCPQLILIPPDFESYKLESREVRKIFERFSDRIEPLSLDEAYIDVTDCKDFQGSATRIAYEIRKMIFQERKLTASAGISVNKFLAKIASDWNKPNGQFVVKPEDIEEFVKALPVEKIHGVGKVTAQKMHSLGLKTCSDIQAQSVAQLQEWFGRRGSWLYNCAQGIDDRVVDGGGERKSLSVEQTFNRDLETLERCLQEIPELYEDWLRRLQRSHVQHKIKNISVKLKFRDFKGTTHETVVKDFPQIEDFKKLLANAWARREEPVRLIGIGAHLLTDSEIKEDASDALENDSQLNFAL
jgi:DNA polymerase-4